jgi:hypothetical protein
MKSAMRSRYRAVLTTGQRSLAGWRCLSGPAMEPFGDANGLHNEDAVTVDRQIVARTVSDLRAALPEADDLLWGLQRVAEATRTVLEVDGAGLTLVHEDGPPRWVAATDAAMELLEHVQHDFGEGPYLQAFAQDRAVSVEDLGAAAAWTRIAAVVGQLHVMGVLSVPVRLAGQPVGTLDVYTTQPRAWTAHELEALAEFASVAAELVHAGVELANRELEVAQLRQALTSASGSSRPKGSWPPRKAPTPRWLPSSSGPRLGRPLASSPRWPRRSSKTPNANGSPASPSKTPEPATPTPAPRPPSRHCRQLRPTWPSAGGPLTIVTALPMSGTVSLRSATEPPVSASSARTSVAAGW